MPSHRFVRYQMRRYAAVLTILGIIAPLACASDTEFNRAEQAYAAGNYRAAAVMLVPLAQAGNPRAQLRLGLMYYLGRAVPEDEATAFEWIRKAADQGLADAQFHAAKMLTFRQGVPGTLDDPDVEAARRYFAAAVQGHAEAQYSLGLMFLVGKGVERSDAEAAKWIRRAAQQGLEQARGFTAAGHPTR